MSCRSQAVFHGCPLVLRAMLLFILFPAAIHAQSSTPAPAAAAPGNPPQSTSSANSNAEVTTIETPTTFRIRVNVVQVRVVVRDTQGNIIDNLKKEDFQLLDNNKPQIISTFSVEHPSTRVLPVASDEAASGTNGLRSTVALPDRFVALVFDDIHLNTQDAVVVRIAADKIINTITPADRVAIYSTSGIVNQEFTNDLAVLRDTLLRVVPRPLQGTTGGLDCPNITSFQAEQMVLAHDPDATSAANGDALACAFNGDPRFYAAAARLAQAKAAQVENQADAEADTLFHRFEEFVRRLSGMPGQRIIAFISPGFASSEASRNLNETIDRAVKANVVVDTIDARGLYTPDMGDISERSGVGVQTGADVRFHLAEQSMAGELLGSLAQGTGGTWFHNRNDLDRGLQQVISAPSVSYVLSFSPQNLKLDGHYHTLKVKVFTAKDLVVQARHGYFAPKTAADPASQAQAEIEEALLSQDELSEIPLELKTRFFMKDTADATLTVLAHVDVKSLHFRKADGRNLRDIVLATAIFDQTGNYVTAGEQTLRMKMQDATLARLNNSGVTVRFVFDLKPGTYMLRLVARDTEDAQMGARNGAVVIPN